MVVHKCIQETPLNTLSIESKYMAENLTKIGNKVDDIIEILNEMKLNSQTENQKTIDNIKEWSIKEFASKSIEKALIWTIWVVASTFITAVTLWVMKLLWKI